MKNQLLKLEETPELKSVESNKSEQIKKAFEPMVSMLSGFEEAYNELISEAKNGITEEVTQKAKRLRIAISKVRISAEKARKEQKEEYLRAGKAIDGVSNILKWAVVDRENSLKEIEKHFEIQEKKRMDELKAKRAEMISPYVENADEINLLVFSDDEFLDFVELKKKKHIELIELERKIELERIEREKKEAAERERIKKENERLRKEAAEREKKARIEAQKRAEEKARYEAKLKAEREEKERIEKEERLKREKIVNELRLKKEAEEKARKEEEERIQNELNKGDSEKVKDLKHDLCLLKEKYSFKSNKNKKMYSDVSLLIDKVLNHIEKFNLNQ